MQINGRSVTTVDGIVKELLAILDEIDEVEPMLETVPSAKMRLDRMRRRVIVLLTKTMSILAELEQRTP